MNSKCMHDDIKLYDIMVESLIKVTKEDER